MKAFVSMVLGVTLLGGCVQRKLAVTSEPSGAVVYLNDQEVGRTPFEREFTWYGRYGVAVRKDGYETLKTESNVTAPWWQWFPFDLVTEVLPLKDRHELRYELKSAATQPADVEAAIARGRAMQSKLESGEK